MQNIIANTPHETRFFRKTTLSVLFASCWLYGAAATAQSSLDVATIAEAAAAATAVARVNHGEIVDALSDNASAVSSAGADAAANIAMSMETSARRSASAVNAGGDSIRQSANLNGAVGTALSAVVVAADDDEITADAGAAANALLNADFGIEQAGDSAGQAASTLAEQTVTLGTDVTSDIFSVADTVAASSNDAADSVREAIDVEAGLDVAVDVAGEVIAASTGSLTAQSDDIGANITSITEITGSVTGALGL